MYEFESALKVKKKKKERKKDNGHRWKKVRQRLKSLLAYWLKE